MRTRAALLSALLASATGCDPDTAVFVEPTISSPSVTLEGSGVLGLSMSGGFALQLHLGPRASDGSEVTLGAFDLMNEDQSVTIVSPLPTVSEVASPVVVDVDSTVDVPVTFDSGADPLTTETEQAICGAGNLVIAGTIQDSLQDGATPVASPPFAPAGCP